MKRFLSIAIVLPVVLTSCSGLTTGQQRELSGAAVGGAAVGAASGYVYNQYDKTKQTEYNKGYAAGQKSASPQG
jgi:hypothetical protein